MREQNPLSTMAEWRREAITAIDAALAALDAPPYPVEVREAIELFAYIHKTGDEVAAREVLRSWLDAHSPQEVTK